MSKTGYADIKEQNRFVYLMYTFTPSELIAM